MAKSKEHAEAIRLRKAGKSIKEISQFLGVSKSSASVWCADVKLTSLQINRLHESMVRGGYKGRLRGARMQKNAKELKIKEYERDGLRRIGSMTRRDLLLLGVGLYLGEGRKSGNKFQFTNSNPGIIKLVLRWLETCFNIKNDALILTLFINKTHVYREEEAKRFWAKVAKVGMHQFRKTIFIKAKHKKMYANFDNHYGTLSIRARSSSDLQYKVLGLCYGVLRSPR